MPCYAVRDSSVVSEIIDGEAIIMDLNSGIYFSSQGSGAIIWDGILKGFDEDQIKQRLLREFNVTQDVLDPDFAAFIEEILANDLVKIDRDAVQAVADWSTEPPATRLSYAAPRLNQYGDMEDLALLDPIHDVAEAEGWPAPKPEKDVEWPGPQARVG